MACEVTFVGGPANGVVRVLPEDEPPQKFLIHVGPTRFDQPPTEFAYVRQVSQMDEGSLWVYVPANPTT